MAEGYTNNASTLLVNTIASGASSMQVVSATGFPTSQFRIMIDNEIMIVTAGFGTTTWTITRAAEGTTAAAHNAATAVVHILTSGAIDQIRADQMRVLTWAQFQALTATDYKTGDRVFISDSVHNAIRTSTGWVYHLKINGTRSVPFTVTNQTTTLGGSIDNIATSFTANAFGTPPSLPFYITIDNEQLKVTNVVGTTWTVTRGDGGTTAAGHTVGATIYQMTMIQRYAVTGNSYFTESNGSVVLDSLASMGDGEHGVALLYPINNSNPWTMTICQGLFHPNCVNYVSAGICTYESSSGKMAFGYQNFYENGWHGASQATLVGWSGSGYAGSISATGDYTGASYTWIAHTPMNPVWQRFVQDGTYLNYYTSYDGFVYKRNGYMSKTNYMTTPDYVGFFISPRNGRIGAHILSFEVTAP